MVAINGCPFVLHLHCLLEMLSVETVSGVTIFQIF